MWLASYFRPAVNAVIGVCACAGLIALAVHHITLIHTASAARAAICKARVEAVLARNPILSKGYFLADDHCRNLAGLMGEEVR